MKAYLYAILAFTIALSLRLYPTLMSGLPFSTDAWSPIRNVELLMERTPIHIGDDEVFDGYNNYWPANILFGAVLSRVVGLRPIDAMAIGVPLTGALTILVFYALVNEVGKNPKLAFFASILLATAYPYALFTAGVTKETYANPLYISSILIFLLSKCRWKKALLFTITSISLALSHHFTSLISLAILASITMASSISEVKKGRIPDKLSPLLVLILATTTALYLGIYAHRGLKLILTPSDWLTVASYQAVAFAVALYFASKPYAYSRRRTILTCSVALALVTLFALICVKRSIIPGAPILPGRYLIYASPYIIASPLVVLGFGWLRETHSERNIAPLFWLATILGLEGYSIFGNSAVGLTLAYRTLNFLWPPLTMLIAAGLQRLCAVAEMSNMKKFVRSAVVTLILVVATVNSYNVHAAVSLQERYMGYFWFYRNYEYEAGEWIAGTIDGQTVAGDVKVSRLLKDYFDVNVDVVKGLRYLTEKGSEPKIMLIYDQMFINGYVLYSGCSIDLPESWVEKLFGLSLVYSNGPVTLYAG